MFRKANANGVGAVIQNHGCCSRLAFQNRGRVDGDFFGSETGARGDRRIHLIGDRRAADGVFDSVENVYDRVRVSADLDFVERIGDARSGFIEEFAVLRKKLDDDRLGRAGQVADHVLKELNELNFRARFGGLNLGSEIGDDIVNVPLAIFLQPDGEIPIVRFGDGSKPQLHAGAAGGVLNFGCGLQNFLNVLEDAVGFCERAAGRREVVQNEPAFIHGGKNPRDAFLRQREEQRRPDRPRRMALKLLQYLFGARSKDSASESRSKPKEAK